MDNELEKQIQARFEELPEDVQKAIQSEDIEKKLTAIGTKHQLHIDQLGALGDETRMVMMGFVDPGEFAQGIAQQLNLDQAKAVAVANDVSTELFVPIRESMQQYMDERALQETLIQQVKTPIPEQEEKSVVMPSQVAKTSSLPVAASSALPSTPSTTSTPTPTVPTMTPSSSVPTPAANTPAVCSADVMLSQTTVSLPVDQAGAPKTPETPKPVPYKADPYREPAE
jgi:uncharacterized protein YciI